jgi:adenylate kinase family enzyme
MKSGKANRIYVIGVTCTGKSTLAKKLSNKLKLPFLSLDDIYYKRKIDIIRPKKEVRKIIRNKIKKNKWVIEGSYSLSPWVKWIAKRADLIIYLDSPTHVLVWRIIKRELTKQNKSYSRIKSIVNLIKLLRNYEKEGRAKAHKKLVETHPNGITIKTNKQLQSFLNSFSL